MNVESYTNLVSICYMALADPTGLDEAILTLKKYLMLSPEAKDKRGAQDKIC